jgi:hypothetical protein
MGKKSASSKKQSSTKLIEEDDEDDDRMLMPSPTSWKWYAIPPPNGAPKHSPSSIATEILKFPVREKDMWFISVPRANFW